MTNNIGIVLEELESQGISISVHNALNKTWFVKGEGIYLALRTAPGCACFALLFLEAKNGRRGVIRFVPAFGQRAGEHELCSRWQDFFRSFAAVQAKQNRQLTLLAENSEIPPRVGPGPVRHNHSKLYLFQIGDAARFAGSYGVGSRVLTMRLCWNRGGSILHTLPYFLTLDKKMLHVVNCAQ